MAIHRIHIDEPVGTGLCRVEGDEAHHAVRVKRLAVGESVSILDGRGGVGSGVVAAVGKTGGNWRLEVRVDSVSRVERELPQLEVCSAIPKGARLSEMIDGLAQVGAAVWRPLETERGEREDWRREKLERIAAEASKQCGRAWRLEIGESAKLEDVLEGAVMADASGKPFHRDRELPSQAMRLLIGPEGGWTKGELESATRAGAMVCQFGVHTMRIETAAVVAAGIVMCQDLGRP